MKPVLKKKTTDTHKELRFRDRSVLLTRILIIMAAIIFGGATALLCVNLQQGLRHQAEFKQLIGLAEAQGGDITVARQIYGVIQKLTTFTKLPEDELPVFATIADVTKLQDQAIFAQALNGDQILIYTKAQKIYIYRPAANLLVAQGPFVMAPAPAPQQQPLPETQQLPLEEKLQPDSPLQPQRLSPAPPADPVGAASAPEASSSAE